MNANYATPIEIRPLLHVARARNGNYRNLVAPRTDTPASYESPPLSNSIQAVPTDNVRHAPSAPSAAMRLIRLGNRMRKCAASADAAQFSAAKRDERPLAARHGRKPGHAHGTADVCHDRSGSRMDLHEASRPNADGADNGHRFPILGRRLIGGVIEGCVLAEKPTLRMHFRPVAKPPAQPSRAMRSRPTRRMPCHSTPSSNPYRIKSRLSTLSACRSSGERRPTGGDAAHR